MAQSRFSRRLGFLVILAALSFSMVLPAFALFDQDDTARGDQSLPIAENFSLTTYLFRGGPGRGPLDLPGD